MHRLVTALLLLAASPAAGGALEEPWLGVYRDPDGLTIFMRQVVTKEPDHRRRNHHRKSRRIARRSCCLRAVALVGDCDDGVDELLLELR